MGRARMRTGLALAGLLGLLWLATAAAENADATTDKYPLPARYGEEGFGLPPEYSINDVVFPASYPDPASLSEGERAMISEGADGYRTPWAQRVYEMAQIYYTHTGALPATIDLDVLRELYMNPEAVDEADLERFRCPLTGELPRLDCREPSPGNMYLHVLTEDEKLYLANLDDNYRMQWIDKQYYQVGASNPKVVPIKGAPPMYYRIYGEHGVLLTGIAFSWFYEDESFLDELTPKPAEARVEEHAAWQPAEVGNGYGEPQFAEGCAPDLVFDYPFPKAAELTPAEQYVVAGQTTELNSAPWALEVFKAVAAYHSQTGQVPERLTPEIIAQLGDGSMPDGEYLARFTSPITGEYPRLNAAEFSPGDVYIRPLTYSEVVWLAQYNQALQQFVVDKKSLDGETGELIDVQPTRVFYTRVYGEHGVIYANLQFGIGH